jgi:murein DD-endopeptidase MepM/ murein hydrolase activator NlpD
VADVAARIGLPAAELARHNGIPQDAVLNSGEVLVLPRRVAEPGAGPIRPAGEVDVAAIADGAIRRAEGGQTGAEPRRHTVQSGETAFSIARRYNVTVEDLAAWNGLGRDLSLRQGQILLIPVSAAPAAAAPEPDPVPPGTGSPTPVPPSAAEPLPADEPAAADPPAADEPPSPDLGADRTQASDNAAMLVPVSGSIIRDFQKGRNNGIDYAAEAGAPVRAADAGTVAAITRDTDQVPIVVVRHAGGLLTVYAGLDDLQVEKGQSVSRGQTIASVRAGDPAVLHFEVRDGLEAVDPNDYLN